MARDHARIHVVIWQDEEFVQLAAAEQRTYLLLLSQPKLSLCGSLDYTPGRWAKLATDVTTSQMAASVYRLVDARYLLVDEVSEELLIRSFVRHDGVCDSPNMVQAMWKAWVGMFSEHLRRAVVQELPARAFSTGFGSEKMAYEPPGEALEMRREQGSTNPSGNPSATPVPVPSPTPTPEPEPLGSVDGLSNSPPVVAEHDTTLPPETVELNVTNTRAARAALRSVPSGGAA
jgi:hypothetical protein